MRIKNKTTPVVFLAMLLGASALAFMKADELYVLAPGLACVIMVLWLWLTLWDRDKKIPFFDVGIFYALTILIYTVYPLLNYWVDGLQFGILSDTRLRLYRISPAELGFFHLRHVLYLFSFVVFYSVFRGRGTIEVGNVSTPSRSTQHVISSHGCDLQRWAPKTYYKVLCGMITQLLLSGQRKGAWEAFPHALHEKPFNPRIWVIMMLGMINPILLAHGKVRTERSRISHLV